MITLTEIFDKQDELMDAMGWPGGSIGEDAAKGHLLAAIHECTEAMNELNWKPWKANKKKVDLDKFATELMDIVQFITNAAIVMGIDERHLENALRKKWLENHERIAKGEVTNSGKS